MPPYVTSLWNDPTRTPNIYDQFIAHGINLDHAIGETPLCCPSRANVLTGLHTHNTRVIRNDAQLFDPSEQIGKSMMGAGYASMYIGKYLNRDNTLTPEQMGRSTMPAGPCSTRSMASTAPSTTSSCTPRPAS